MKLTTLLLTLCLSSSAAFAFGGKGDHHQRAEKFRQQLNLSDEQSAKVQEIRSAHKPGVREARQKFKASKEDFKSAMKRPESTQEELKAKFDAFQASRDEFQRKRFAMMLEMRAVLNPEQREKFAEMKKEWKKKRRGERRYKKGAQD
jgi:Spy/CpxP family protein refolding chaperone